MFRRWLSSFWKRNKFNIKKYLKTCCMFAIVAYMAFTILSVLSDELKDKEDVTYNKNEVYNPQKTIASGEDISSEKYTEDKEVLNIFLDYCNKGEIESAYSLLTDYCKQELYPNLSDFEELYYNSIFTNEKKYNLQSWITESDYHTYVIRYIDDIMATGVYDKNNVYQDYITICRENNEKKISIGKYIKFEDLDIKSEIEDGIKINITGKKIYIDSISYILQVENKTGKTICLDSYENLRNTVLVMNNKAEYSIDWNKLDKNNLIIKNGQKILIEYSFNTPHGISSKPKYLQMREVILDYGEYEKIIDYNEKINYKNRKKIEINM